MSEYMGGLPILTLDAARKQREIKEEGYIFPLRATGDFIARVRVPDIKDKLFLNRLSDTAQQLVAQSLLDMEMAQRPPDQREKTGPRSQKEAWKLFYEKIADQETVANELVCECFIEPRVCMTDAARRDPADLVVTDIDIADRVRFAEVVLSGEGAAAFGLSLFRARPLENVSAQSRHEAPAAPERIPVSQFPGME